MEAQHINIAINGAAGRMGRVIARVIEGIETITVAHAYDRPDSSDITKRLCEVTRSQSQIVIEPSNMMSEGQFDVLIDFSTPTSVIDAAQCCRLVKRPMVIGVTGFNDSQKEKLQELAKEIPMLIAPNMSVGVNLCFKLLEQITRTSWGKGAQIDIIETHHENKKDRPSGTALKMGEIIAKEKGGDLDDIPIESYREGEVMGEHRVFFSTAKERIELRHEALDRTPFANGAVYAAQWIVGTRQRPGKVYTMDDAISMI